MWDIYSFNFDLRGVGYSEVSSDIVKRYSKGGIIEGGKGKPLTNRGLIKLFDNFLVRTYNLLSLVPALFITHPILHCSHLNTEMYCTDPQKQRLRTLKQMPILLIPWSMNHSTLCSVNSLITN